MQNLERTRLRMILVLVGVLYPFYCGFASMLDLLDVRWWMILPSSVLAGVLLYADATGKKVLSWVPLFIYASAIACGYQILDSGFKRQFIPSDMISILVVGSCWMAAQASFRWAMAFALSYLVMVSFFIFLAPTFPFPRIFVLNGLLTVDVVLAVILYIYRRSQQEMLLTRNMMDEQNQDSVRQLQNLQSVSNTLGRSVENFQRAIEQAMTATEEIRQTTVSNQDLSSHSHEIVEKFKKNAERASQEQEEMLAAIAQLDQASLQITSVSERGRNDIQKLESVMHEIQGVVRVVSDVVLQSKLLSFNASVEAARAGEHGKGFLVVAEEVGTLAQTSEKAAKTIHQVVSENQKQFGLITAFLDHALGQLKQSMEESIQSIRGRAKVYDKVFTDIVASSKSMSDQLSGLNEAFNEIMTAIDQMVSAVQELQKNSGAISELATQTQTTTSRISRQVQNNENRIAVLTAFTHPLDDSPKQGAPDSAEAEEFEDDTPLRSAA